MLNSSISKKELEITLLKTAIYYTFATIRDNNEIVELQRTFEILKQELSMIDEDKTLFYFENIEHVVNTLSETFKNIEKEDYKELVKTVMIKINYYNGLVKNLFKPLMSVASDEDVESLAQEIYYGNAGYNEIKETSDENINAKYELQERLFYGGFDSEAYEIDVELANIGHQKAKYNKAWCLYHGNGVEKDYKKAFEVIKELLDEGSVYSKAIELIGEMYYEGNGVEKNYKKALEYFEQIEEIDHFAKFYIGKMKLFGYGIEKDEKIGLESIEESAKRKNGKAIKFIIKHYKNKDMIRSNLKLDEECINELTIRLDEMEFKINRIKVIAENQDNQIVIYLYGNTDTHIDCRVIIEKSKDNKYYIKNIEPISILNTSIDDLIDDNELFDDTETVDEIKENYEEYSKIFFDKFGEYPYISETGGTYEKAIEAIKICLKEDKNILDQIYYPQISVDKKPIPIVPTMISNIEENAMWCLTFQLIWDDFKKEILENDFSGDFSKNIIKDLMNDTNNSNSLSDDDFYKIYGKANTELKEKIEKELLAKFHENSKILEQISFEDGNTDKIILYSMLKKKFEFPISFERLENSKFGDYNKDVEYFGISEYTVNREEIAEQVNVLFYNSENDFAILLTTKNKENVILYRTDNCKNFEETYIEINNKAQNNSNYRFTSEDTLKIPKLSVDEKCNYEELEGVSFIRNSDNTPFIIAKALQNIKFNLDENGGRIKSEAVMELREGCAFIPKIEKEKRDFNFNNTFYLYLVEENKEKPYFASRINNIELFIENTDNIDVLY